MIDVPFDVDLLARLMRLAAAAACGVWLVRHRHEPATGTHVLVGASMVIWQSSAVS